MKIRTKLVLISTILNFSLLLGVCVYILLDTKYSYEELAYKRNLSYINIIKEYLQEHHGASVDSDSTINNMLPNEIEKIYYQIYDKDNNLIASEGNIFNDLQYKQHLANRVSKEVFDIDEDAHFFLAIKEYNINGEDYIITVAIRAYELELEYYGIKIIYLLMFLMLVPIIALLELYLSRLAFNPVKNIIKNVKQITSTNLNKRLNIYEPKDEIRELSETLNTMISRLEESFESQKRFIADASHEIKTPLTIIRAELELLKNKKEVDEEQIDNLLSEIDRLTNLSKSLLLLARLDGKNNLENCKKLRIDEILLDVVQGFNNKTLQRKIDMVFNVNDFAEIYGDEAKLKSVFFNLIDNAVKYSSDNSTISITQNNKNNLCEVLIEDTGFGIEAEELSKIFKRFYRSNEYRATVQGSGLGLSIVKEIIEQHNGKINITSKKGKGTTVIVTFPLV